MDGLSGPFPPDSSPSPPFAQQTAGTGSAARCHQHLKPLVASPPSSAASQAWLPRELLTPKDFPAGELPDPRDTWLHLEPPAEGLHVGGTGNSSVPKSWRPLFCRGYKAVAFQEWEKTGARDPHPWVQEQAPALSFPLFIAPQPLLRFASPRCCPRMLSASEASLLHKAGTGVDPGHPPSLWLC